MRETPIVLETGDGSGIDFLTFGLREAFGTRLGIKCSFTRKDVPSLSPDFQENLRTFVETSTWLAREHRTDEMCIHLSAGAVPIPTAKGSEVVHFALTSVLRSGRVAHTDFEAFGEYDSPEVGEFVTFVAAMLAKMRPLGISPSEHVEAERITKIVQEGYAISLELLGNNRVPIKPM